MPVINRSTRPFSEPGTKLQHPWRFTLGQHVHVLGTHTSTLQVVGGTLLHGFPHLHALDIWGATWQIPQIHASSTPLVFRKG